MFQIHISKLLILALLLYQPLHAFHMRSLVWDDKGRFMTPVMPDDIVAKIDFFSKDHGKVVIHYADLSTPEPFGGCPLDSLPTDLKKVVEELVSKIKQSTEKIQEIRGAKCEALKKRAASSEGQLTNALQYQFLSSSAIASTTQQNTINQFTRQSTALTQLVFLTSDLLDAGCLVNGPDKIAIQKLIGQTLALSGLLVGGWEGIAIAAFGQLFASVPLFHSQVEKTLIDLRQYDERAERINFLCWYRQMLKTSALLFPKPRITVINGVDLTFKSGPAHVTLQTLAGYERTDRGLLRDVKILSEINKSQQDLLDKLETEPSEPADLRTSFNKIKDWCSINRFFNPFEGLLYMNNIHPRPVMEAIYHMRQYCAEVNSFLLPKNKELNKYVNKFHRAALVLNEYYKTVLEQKDSHIGKIAATWESLKFFEKTRDLMTKYQNSTAGNQARLNFRALTEHIGDHYAHHAFRKIMRQDVRAFKARGSDRRRIIKAMIATCQTFDPTLVALGVNDPKHNSFFKLWKRKCVGPKSDLCKHVVGKKHEFDLLASNNLEDRAMRVYFYSLCGHWRPN